MLSLLTGADCIRVRGISYINAPIKNRLRGVIHDTQMHDHTNLINQEINTDGYINDHNAEGEVGGERWCQ